MDLLVVLLNYRRESNLERIIDALRQQTVRVRIAVWNNGTPRSFSGADVEFQSPENLRCMPRWHVASLIGREYVAVLDDDLLPLHPNLLEKCVEKSRKFEDAAIIGRTGVSLGSAPRYYKSGAHRGVGDDAIDPGDVFADIVKGRFMFMHLNLLRRAPLHCPYYRGRGDDIWISLKTSTARDQHVIPAFTRDAFEPLPEGEESLCGGSDHYHARDEIVRAMLENGEVSWADPDALRRRRSFLGSRA